jgi:hypothetical protein
MSLLASAQHCQLSCIMGTSRRERNYEGLDCKCQVLICRSGVSQHFNDLFHVNIYFVGGRVAEDFPVLVTSYEIVIADAKFLQKMKFQYIVVDEGHRLKNFDCKLIRELKLIPAANRLLLSGDVPLCLPNRATWRAKHSEPRLEHFKS